MIIEAVRLVVTLATTAAGFLVGRSFPDWFPESGFDADVAAITGAVLGAGIGYVAGGLLGRLIRRVLERAPELAARATGPQLFAGTFGLLAGLAVGVVAGVPAVALLPPYLGWPVAMLAIIVLAAAGATVFAARSDDLLAAAGLRPRRVRPSSPPGGPAFVLDTSAAIDGRILELCRARLVSGDLVVPEFVLDELQGIADSGAVDHRRRGRRGLDVLEALREIPWVDFRPADDPAPEQDDVDAKLLALCALTGGTLVSTDANLVKAAALRGIGTLNPHGLGESLRPQAMPGDRLALHVERPGSEPGQGVGYLDDGTMVVVEDAAGLVGETIDVEVATSLRTSVGRMLFARRSS